VSTTSQRALTRPHLSISVHAYYLACVNDPENQTNLTLATRCVQCIFNISLIRRVDIGVNWALVSENITADYTEMSHHFNTICIELSACQLQVQAQ